MYGRGSGYRFKVPGLGCRNERPGPVSGIRSPADDHDPECQKLLDIDFHDPATSHLHRRSSEVLEGLVRGATRPEAIREVVKRLLVHSFEHHRDRAAVGAFTRGSRLKVSGATSFLFVQDYPGAM